MEGVDVIVVFLRIQYDIPIQGGTGNIVRLKEIRLIFKNVTRSLCCTLYSKSLLFLQSVQMQLLWQLRKMSFSSLVSVLTLQIDHQHTDLQKRVSLLVLIYKLSLLLPRILNPSRIR